MAKSWIGLVYVPISDDIAGIALVVRRYLREMRAACQQFARLGNAEIMQFLNSCLQSTV